MTTNEAENEIVSLNVKYYKDLKRIVSQVTEITEQEQIKLMFVGISLIYELGCANLLVEDEKKLDEALATTSALVRMTVLKKWGKNNGN